MNENLNLVEILKDCPKNTELYSTTNGTVCLTNISDSGIYPICTISKDGYKTEFTRDGKFFDYKDSECVLFPSKEQRDWSKFKAPIERFDPKEFKPFDKILVRDNYDCEWRIDLFSRLGIDGKAAIGLMGYPWRTCVPYNDDTKNLLNTKFSCPEYYKWWKK